MSLGFTEIALIVGIALLFFGPSRLPGLGKSIGEAIRGFKKGISEEDTTAKQAATKEPMRETLTYQAEEHSRPEPTHTAQPANKT